MYKTVLALLLAAAPLAAAIPQSQRDALIAIYDGTGGPDWTRKDNWKSAAGTECTWYGVICNEAQTSVVELTLDNNNLTGPLPSAIGAFPDLRTLLLFDDRLSGPLPAAIGQLANLEVLYTQRNAFSGPIPREIGSLHKLISLGLNGNKHTGPLPQELGNLTALEELGLTENKIDGTIPPQLAQLANLRTLDLAANELTGGIPPELGSMARLEGLYLAINKLEGTIPSQLGSLTSLHEMRLSYNKLSGQIPTTFSGLRNLERLDVASNALTGSLPREIAELPNLKFLDLMTNDLEGALPAELFRQASLEELNLSSNRFTGTIPATIGALTNLQVLSLGNNGFTGHIPREIGALTKLRQLELLSDKLDGEIPEEIGNLKELTYLDLAGNKLTGRIPAKLGSLTKLQFFSMYENQLEGSIPPELGNLTELDTLYLTSNRLTGTIPDTLRNLKKLTSFYLGGNQLSGSIPDWIGELTQLSVIYFPSNQFTGSIPASIGNLTNLGSLYLGANPLSGSIPREIGNLRQLGYLSLEDTDIGGPIPPDFWNLTDLAEVRLNNMQLTGTLPREVGNLKKAIVFLLNDNHLEGSLPGELGDMSGTLYLSLGANRFSGPIPAALGNLTQLISLGLYSNALRGEVPSSLRSLTNLEDGNSDFTFNAIFASDSATREFLGRKQWDPDLHHTQTLTPTNVRVTQTTDRSATLEWDLISYRDNDGGYQVVASTTPGGAAAVIATTASKDDASIVVRGLQPSTTYFFTVSAVTHPHDFQQNLLTSDPSGAVSGATTARVIAPPDVVVTEHTNGLVQVDGTAQNEDSFTLTNFGDVASAITFAKEGTFFTIDPEALTLAAGASQTVRVRSVAQPAGTYYGSVQPQGAGAGDDDDIVYITLLSVARPRGTVIAEALSTRIEVAGAAGSDSVGAARFRNIGTAPLSGIILSDQPWVVPSPNPITIDPGTTGTANFTVVRSRRPEGVEGALTANLSLVYVDGSSGAGFNALQTGGGSGISVTLVTIVDTSKPSTNQGALPGLGAGEVALFGSGLASFVRANNQYVSDLSLANASGSRSINDVRLYFTPANATQTTVAALSSIGSSQSVSLANVVSSVYGTESSVGTLQIRTAAWQSLAAQAKLVNLKSNGTYSGDVPLFRSDRAAPSGQATYLTGVRKSATTHTDLYLQETAGGKATARVELLDSSGTAVASQSVSLDAFGMSELLDVVPATAVTAVVTTNSGRIAAYARVTDDASGDTWSIVDWSRVQRFTLTEPVRVLSLDGGGGVSRRRRAIRPSSDAVTAPSTTEVTLFNPTTSEARVKIESGAEYVVGPKKTMTIANAGVITPARGQLVVSARTYRTANGTYGAAIPVVSAVAGLRVGQSQRFSGLDDSTAKTVAAATPGTFRTSFGLVETSGAPVTVRTSMRLDMGRSLVSAIVSREIKLAARQQMTFPDLVKAIVGDARETELGELHNLSLELEVTDGKGSVIPFVIVTDNGSGDSIVRVE